MNFPVIICQLMAVFACRREVSSTPHGSASIPRSSAWRPYRRPCRPPVDPARLPRPSTQTRRTGPPIRRTGRAARPTNRDDRSPCRRPLTTSSVSLPPAPFSTFLHTLLSGTSALLPGPGKNCPPFLQKPPKFALLCSGKIMF